jgi:hypothetical protein
MLGGSEDISSLVSRSARPQVEQKITAQLDAGGSTCQRFLGRPEATQVKKLVGTKHPTREAIEEWEAKVEKSGRFKELPVSMPPDVERESDFVELYLQKVLNSHIALATVLLMLAASMSGLLPLQITPTSGVWGAGVSGQRHATFAGRKEQRS